MHLQDLGADVMAKFMRSLDASFTRYINSLEAIGYQRDSEVFKLLCAIFVLHCFDSKEISHNLTDKQEKILRSLLECLYVDSCLFRKTDFICDYNSNTNIDI